MIMNAIENSFATTVAHLRATVDGNSCVPLYHQIATELETLIQEAVLQPGDALPSDAELSRELGVNPPTVRRAMAGLVDKGLVVRKRQAGAFVARPDHVRSRNIGFFYIREDQCAKLQVAETVQKELADSGYDLKLIGIDATFYERESLPAQIARMDLVGAILVALPGEACRKALQELDAAHFPYLRLGNRMWSECLRSPLVCSDVNGAASAALRLLADRGHQEIGALISPDHDQVAVAFREAFISDDEKREARLFPIRFTGPHAQWHTFREGPLLVRGYLETHREVTALVVEHASCAVEVVRQCRAMGRRIPDDLSLVCLFDHPILEATDPTISAFHVPPSRVGLRAARRLLHLLRHDESPDPALDAIQHDLIDRQSIAPR